MIFDNSQIRRKDRTLTEERCRLLLKSGEYGILSLSGDDFIPYGIPINYVWDNHSALYFHCAPEGKKLKIIEKNRSASFCIVGNTNVISNKFTTEYMSVILTGNLSPVFSEEEKMNALRLILDKYCPTDKELGLKYAQKSFHRTHILRLDINTFSGKAKSLNITSH